MARICWFHLTSEKGKNIVGEKQAEEEDDISNNSTDAFKELNVDNNSNLFIVYLSSISYSQVNILFCIHQ